MFPNSSRVPPNVSDGQRVGRCVPHLFKESHYTRARRQQTCFTVTVTQQISSTDSCDHNVVLPQADQLERRRKQDGEGLWRGPAVRGQVRGPEGARVELWIRPHASGARRGGSESSRDSEQDGELSSLSASDVRLTHCLSLSHCLSLPKLSLSLTLSLAHSLTVSHSLSLLLSLSLSLSLTISYCLSLTQCLSYSLSYSLTVFLSLSLSHCLSLTHSLSLTVSLSVSLSLSL